jgi:16S rRNA (cytosine1402-N4)-methyltransferase
MYHIPVLLNQSVDGLNIQPEGTYVDATFGGGGHSKVILNRLTSGRLFAFDQDMDAEENIFDDDRFTFINQNFSYIKNYLRFYNALPVNGILADLGVSSHQFDTASRGFSTRLDGELDMRMNSGDSLTAAEIVNTYDEDDLISLFREYGEIKNSRCVAKSIIAAREQQAITTTLQLSEIVGGCFPANKKNKFLALVFQALRIQVNGELSALKSLLKQSIEILGPGGRLVVLSYHSLEDRLVKNFIRTGNFEGNLEKDFYGNPIVELKAINTKPIVPDEDEININSRARSAKLRIAEKI